MKWLIVGGTGLIGRSLFNQLYRSKEAVIKTSHDKVNLCSDTLHLNLVNFNQLQYKRIDFDIAVICAGISNIYQCEKNPIDTYFINVEQTYRLIESLINSGLHVIYLSSSAVFDGEKSLPKELSLKSPTCEYGKQKAILEDRLLKEFHKKISIIRLTKVLSQENWLIAELKKCRALGNEIKLFNDYYFSPISIDYTVSGIIEIGKNKYQDIFHLSHNQEFSYYSFGEELNRASLSHMNIISPKSCKNISNIIYNPKFVALDMTRTSTITKSKIIPEDFNQLINNLL